MTAFSFSVLKTDGAARLGRIETAHGPVDTPTFMPVGTAGTVKGMLPESVASTGAQMILGNTYHLMLRPGADRVQSLGGLHQMMNWPGPILTDSGGFQVMSLAKLRKMTEDGVTFRSHIDGSSWTLTPEYSTDIQYKLDATVTMAFDECTPWPVDKKTAAHSMRLSMRWAVRSRSAFVPREGYGQFGIVQGSVFPDLRAESMARLREIDFEGYAVGGLAVGEGQELMFQTLDSTVPDMPVGKPRYLMGVGKPSDMVGAVARGIDMFDCVMPTRSGRTAQAFTRRGTVNLRNARHQDDPRPLEENCSCPACRQYTRAYLHHLIRAGEMLGPMLLTWHNIQHYQDIMKDLRSAIGQGTLSQYRTQFEASQALGDIEPLTVEKPE
ncbi:tRNA guanosine(34) transglycosylase Tgt [Haematospirillum jordaniae]|uniref:Queuine tRNA-ribosyltransferase n=1 Tax=Haematospirillum jordaniae TaxID=1549855 RepID=A0A143DD21_9PROT|nr:tRNA guanosine(34) transglycosylase Tgt [Haematospirillum jordaniae]AMW34651.1 tRNA-guanine(34) transglycosylase [Haematospirillum jordaniae]NKD44819.1 tRNA guanosine(34) transglycosylase Tgt [Haematospirillum jordaniae]NKD57010.1 tRNA guanosine(34) transglycosylase Tgt [Haematospirillum jordaniae]NKD58834.1 tRNA guanosine(34) transglycosylase Tgt [Haematospirillum jordaniae]NKD66935.1 tRNA guanosine(34) transglycosylase Tgt [Haematospirillum jordaniae]